MAEAGEGLKQLKKGRSHAAALSARRQPLTLARQNKRRVRLAQPALESACCAGRLRDTLCCVRRLSRKLNICAALKHPPASANMAALSAFCRARSHTFRLQRRSRLHPQQRKRQPCSTPPCTAPPTSPRRCATRRWMCASRQEHACRLFAIRLARAACAENPTLCRMADAHAHCVSRRRPPAPHKHTVAAHRHRTFPSGMTPPSWPALRAAFSNRLNAEPSAHLIAGLPCSQPASRAVHSELAAAA